MGWAILLLGGYLGLFSHFSPVALNDPDRYFNLRMASITAEQGIVRALPQFPDLGWDQSFSDKEFLYHQILAVFYRAGGEGAVRLVAPVMAGTLILILFCIVSASAPNWFAAVSVGTGALLAWSFLFRLNLLRSWVWAAILFVILVWSLERRKIVLVALAGMFFSLSYNALFVPIVPLALLVGVEWRDRRVYHCVLAELGGLLAGVLVNPYFPHQLDMVWLSLSIATGSLSVLQVRHGMEVRSLPLLEIVTSYPVALAFTLIGLFLAISLRSIRFRAGLATFFCVGLFFSARAAEYFVPVSLLLAPEVWKVWGRGSRWRMAVLLGVAILQFGAIVPRFRDTLRPSEKLGGLQKLLQYVPTGQKVVNAEWDTGAILFYLRPDLRIVDALDPNLLPVASPELHALRASLERGDPRDWKTIFRTKFKSEWILTRRSELWAHYNSQGWVALEKTSLYRNLVGGIEGAALILVAQ